MKRVRSSLGPKLFNASRVGPNCGVRIAKLVQATLAAIDVADATTSAA
jgi:hypothetical protein